jgi:dienelactone hydrolase
MAGLIHRAIAVIGMILVADVTTQAHAQSEFPPPHGKGPVVVVVSGQLGAAHYEPPARQIAELGYDVVLLDGNDMEGSHGKALWAAVEDARKTTHGFPGKVAVVGFSLGGGEALAYASRWPNTVAVVIAWYPATSGIHDMPGFVRGIKVPVLMFAGESDHYRNCCLADTARAMAVAASAQGLPFELVTYPGTDHDFIFPGPQYNAEATSDSWRRAEAKLAQSLGR